MKVLGRIKDISIEFGGGGATISFTTDANKKDLQNAFNELKDKLLDINFGKHSERRSLDANGLMWACLKDMRDALNNGESQWDLYLKMLRRYGSFTYICVKPKAVERVMREWRETEVIGEIEINGAKAVQLLCYYGSSTYDTEEMSRLLNGIISEMREMGLTPPPSKDMRRALEKWNEEHPAS